MRAFFYCKPLTIRAGYDTFVWPGPYRSFGGRPFQGCPWTAENRLGFAQAVFSTLPVWSFVFTFQCVIPAACRLVFDQAAFSMRFGSGLGAAFRGSDLPCGKLELPAASSPEADFSGKILPVNKTVFVNLVSENFSGEFLKRKKAGEIPGFSHPGDYSILNIRVVSGRLFTAFPRPTQQNAIHFVAFVRAFYLTTLPVALPNSTK